MLCTSGFMDNVTFGCNGLYAMHGRLNLKPTTTGSVAIPGRSLMSINALFVEWDAKPYSVVELTYVYCCTYFVVCQKLALMLIMYF